jgi:ATP-binding cassette subfamily B protein
VFCEKWTGVLLLLSPAADFSIHLKKDTAIHRMVRLLMPLKKHVLMLALGAAAYTLLGFSTALFMRFLFDSILPGRNHSLLQVASVGMLLLLLLQVAIGTIRSLVGSYMGQILDSRLITGYYRHLFRLSKAFFDSMRLGEI